MRKAGVLLTAGLLVLAGGAARAQETPADGGSSSAPGSAPVASGTLEVEKVTLSVDGKTVEAAPPGVEVVAVIRLHNFSSEAARNVKAHVEPPQNARLVDADATYGDIAAGAGADGTFRLVVSGDPCPDFVGLGGEITYDGGTTPLKIGIATACPGPRLSIQDVRFEGGDGDGVPEPGETLRAFVIVRNDGRDAATNVRATSVTVTGKGVSSTTDGVTWPDIAPGGSEASTNSLVVTIADDAPRQEGCPPFSGSGVAEVPPAGGGTVSSDTPVSSDGSTGSGGNVASEPAPPPTATAEPGTTIVEPQPGIATGEPAPSPSTGSVEPEPAPAPGTPKPGTEPDRPVLVELHAELAASGYTSGADYSNGTVCAVEAGAIPALGAPAKQPLARDTAAPTKRGSAAVPIGVAALLSAAAVGLRRLLVP